MKEHKISPVDKPLQSVPQVEKASMPLTDQLDHYFENGYMVFTEAHHLKRGYCCKNGCRHCPYGCKKKP